PDVEEEPAVALVCRMTALQREGCRGGDEVDEQEGEEVGDELFKAGGGGGLGVVVQIDEVVDHAGQEHEVDKGRDQGQKHLEDEDVGQGEDTHGLIADEGEAVLPDGLQYSKRPAKALEHEALNVDGSLSEGQGAVFIVDVVALFEEVHGEVGVFG